MLFDDPPGFWTGATLWRLNDQGQRQRAWRVVDSTSDALQLSQLDVHEKKSDSTSQAPDSPVAVRKDEPHRRWELDAGIEAPVLGIRRLLGIPLGSRLPPLRIRLGTTRGTNALLTRKGAAVALATTAPFADLLRIGDQTRPDLFELAVRRPPPLAQHIACIEERLAADGSVLNPLDYGQARAALREAQDAGCHVAGDLPDAQLC